MEWLESQYEERKGLLIFQQVHPWSQRYGPTSLLHVTIHTRSCYSHVRLPEKLSRWSGDEVELEGLTKYGLLTSYCQYSKHLDQVPIEERIADFDDKEFNLEDKTYKFRISPDSYETNKLPYMALKPEYMDRSKRIIFL